MRLYTTTGAAQVDDPEFGTFKADANGAFDGLPDAMYAKLHGRPGWENDPERELRITKEELDRFRDPAELLKAVKELGANQGVFAAALATALGVAQQSAAPAPTSVQDAVPPAPADASDSDTEVSAAEGDSSAGSDKSPANEPESQTPVETAAPAKVTSSRGRGAKAAKTAVSDAS